MASRRHVQSGIVDIKKKPFTEVGGPPGPSRIEHHYGPEVLELAGPVLSAEWSVPSVIQKAIEERNSSVPEPVGGLVLLDTGASSTCISMNAAELLHLKPTRLATGYGAGGKHTNPIFLARLLIEMSDVSRDSFEWQGEVQGVPDLEKHSENLALTRQGRPVHLVGLLGRDILRRTRLEYDGLAGMLRLDFDPGWTSSAKI